MLQVEQKNFQEIQKFKFWTIVFFAKKRSFLLTSMKIGYKNRKHVQFSSSVKK